MTPRLFSLLVNRYREQMKRADRRAGGVIAMLYNINRDSKLDPNGLDWQDFFTEWKEVPREQTEKEMIETMSAFATSTQELSA